MVAALPAPMSECEAKPQQATAAGRMALFSMYSVMRWWAVAAPNMACPKQYQQHFNNNMGEVLVGYPTEAPTARTGGWATYSRGNRSAGSRRPGSMT